LIGRVGIVNMAVPPKLNPDEICFILLLNVIIYILYGSSEANDNQGGRDGIRLSYQIP
jgi:hypothetical protein